MQPIDNTVMRNGVQRGHGLEKMKIKRNIKSEESLISVLRPVERRVEIRMKAGVIPGSG